MTFIFNQKHTELFDALDDTCDALKAFEFMLGATLAEYLGATDKIDCGISGLLRHQVEDLSEIAAQIRDAFRSLEALAMSAEDQAEDTAHQAMTEERLNEIIRTAVLADAGRPAWHDLDTIAARSRVRKCDVARVMFILTGEDHEGTAYRAWDGNLAAGMHSHLLASLCWEALSHGDMWGQVSTATGLSLEKVREILQAVLEYTPKRKAIDLRPFGEVLAVKEAEKAMLERVAEQDAQGPSETALADAVDRLRRADLGEIAREVNLDESAVRRVVDKLLAEPHPDPETAVSNG